MKSDDIVILFCIVGIMLGVLVGGCSATSNLKHEAIRAGAAYYTNDASGKLQFKWKECK